MPGVLLDVNVGGMRDRLRGLIKKVGLGEFLQIAELQFMTFADESLPGDLDDRSLWHYCERRRLVLLTDNRNHNARDSLQATLDDSWRLGDLPILTITNKLAFSDDQDYAERFATDLVEAVCDIADGNVLAQPRLWLPFK
jgi:hypothetical protein